MAILRAIRQGGLGPLSASVTSTDLLLWVLLLAAMILAGAGVLLLRRRLLGKERPADAGRLLDQVEKLRAQGALTEEEYRRARAAMLGRPADKAPQAAPSSCPPETGDAPPPSGDRPADEARPRPAPADRQQPDGAAGQ